METIRYCEKDGHKIVTGFDRLQPDPVATQKRIKAILAREGLPGKIKQLNTRLVELWSWYSAAKKKKNPGKMKLWQREYDDINAARVEAYKALKARISILKKQKCVYMRPRRNEVIVAPETLELIRNQVRARKPGEAVTVEGKTIEVEIPKLSDAQKAQILDAICTTAVTQRSMLEVKGMAPDKALAESQEWYNKEVKKVIDKYKQLW